MTPLEMQDRWLKWDIIFVERTENRARLNEINMACFLFFFLFLIYTLSNGHSDVTKSFTLITLC